MILTHMAPYFFLSTATRMMVLTGSLLAGWLSQPVLAGPSGQPAVMVILACQPLLMSLTGETVLAAAGQKRGYGEKVEMLDHPVHAGDNFYANCHFGTGILFLPFLQKTGVLSRKISNVFWD